MIFVVIPRANAATLSCQHVTTKRSVKTDYKKTIVTRYHVFRPAILQALSAKNAYAVRRGGLKGLTGSTDLDRNTDHNIGQKPPGHP